MRSAPRKHSGEETLYAAALRALGRRAYSVFEMRTYLERRAEDKNLARQIVARLRQEKLIDDARYAFEFARARVNFRKQGRYRIVRELRQRGVPDPHIEAAVEQVFAENDEGQLLRKLIERRLRAARPTSVSKPPKDVPEIRGKRATGAYRKPATTPEQKKMASLYRTLLRAGFDSQLVRRELQAAKIDAPDCSAELPEIDPSEAL